MFLFSLQNAQATILGFVAIILLIFVILSVKKWGAKSLIYWLIVGLMAFLYIADTVLN